MVATEHIPLPKLHRRIVADLPCWGPPGPAAAVFERDDLDDPERNGDFR
jgi:hypothetical protein